MWTRSPDGRLYRRSCIIPLIWIRSQYRSPYGRLHRSNVLDVNRHRIMAVGATYDVGSVTVDSSATSSEDDDDANCPVFVIIELDHPTDKEGSMFFLAS